MTYKNTPFPKQYTILSNKWGAVQYGSGAFVRLGADQLLLEEDGFTILLAGILFMAEVLRSFSSVLP